MCYCDELLIPYGRIQFNEGGGNTASNPRDGFESLVHSTFFKRPEIVEPGPGETRVYSAPSSSSSFGC